MPDSGLTTTAMADWTTSALVRQTAQAGYEWGAGMVVLICVLSVVGFVLNIAALAVLMKKKNRRTATNMYLMHLALGKLYASSLSVTFALTILTRISTSSTHSENIVRCMQLPSPKIVCVC